MARNYSVIDNPDRKRVQNFSADRDRDAVKARLGNSASVRYCPAGMRQRTQAALGGHLRRFGIAYLTLCLGLSVTAAAFWRTLRQVDARKRLEFETSAQAVDRAMDLHFSAYLNVLAGVKGLFDASEVVTPRELADYLHSIDLKANHPGLLDLGYIERVPAAELTNHIRRVRGLGFTNYTPLLDPAFLETYPIVYLEDFKSGGVCWGGWNAFREPERRVAMSRARDTGNAAASARVELETLDHQRGVYGFLIYLPIYSEPQPPPALPDRQAALRGFVFGSILASELWNTVLRSSGNPSIGVEIYGDLDLDSMSLLFSSRSTEARQPAAAVHHRPKYTMERWIGGLQRTWSMRYWSLPDLESGPESLLPWSVLAGGLVLSAGLSGLMWREMRGRQRAEAFTSELRKAAENLRASEAQFRAIFLSIQDVYYRADLQGRIELVSPSCQAFGYTPQELIGMPTAALYENSPDREEYFNRLLRDGVVHDFEVRLRCKDGTVRTISISAHLLKDAAGQPTGSEGLLRDITERKRVEAALRESQERVRTVLHGAPVVLYAIDVNGLFTFSEGKGLATLGLQPGQVLGQSVYEIYREHPNVLTVVRRALAGEEFSTVVEVGPLVFETWQSPTRDARGAINGMIGIATDISNRRRAEESLAQERLKSGKLESLGILAGGLAHDFNNILTGIIGNISLATASTEDAEEVRQRLADAEKACWRARGLTQQLLTFAKGGAPIRETAVLTDIIRDSARFVTPGSNVQCVFHLPADLWTVEADKGQMSQVIQNIVLNAVQAMPEGGTVDIHAENFLLDEATALSLPPGRYVRITIIDHGTGIRPEHLPRVFDPYFTTKQKGSGLGLATAYSIIKRHDGLLTVESELGAGTRFDLHLPASNQPAPPPERERPLTQGEGRILVMDDEPVIRQLLGVMLKRLGYQVAAVTEGAEAVRCYAEARNNGSAFRAVILDLTIPGGMGGKETMRQLLALDPHVKGIVSSGYSYDPVMANYREHGFQGVVVKPYAAAQLAEVLASVLPPTASAG